MAVLEKNQNLVGKVEILQSKKKQIYGFSVFTIVVLFVLIVFAIRPSIGTIISLNREIKEKQKINTQLEDKINTLGSLASEYSELEPVVKDLELLYPTNGDFSLFMANIEEVAEDNGFSLQTINFGGADAFPEELSVDTLSYWGASINVVGQEENIIPFLKAVEAMPNFPIVERISYSNDEDEEGNIQFSVSLVFYQIEDENFYE